MKTHIRWMVSRDMPEVLAIEDARFRSPLSESDTLKLLRRRNVIGMAATHREAVVGFMIYELHKDHLRVLDFAVHPAWERKGVGRQMAARLAEKLSPARREWIEMTVRESNLDGQLFLRAEGFRAVEVLRGHYPDTGEDAYAMRYDFADAPAPCSHANRIARHFAP